MYLEAMRAFLPVMDMHQGSHELVPCRRERQQLYFTYYCLRTGTRYKSRHTVLPGKQHPGA